MAEDMMDIEIEGVRTRVSRLVAFEIERLREAVNRRVDDPTMKERLRCAEIARLAPGQDWSEDTTPAQMAEFIADIIENGKEPEPSTSYFERMFEIDDKTLEYINELKEPFGVTSAANVIKKSLVLMMVVARYMDSDGCITMISKDGKKFRLEMR